MIAECGVAPGRTHRTRDGSVFLWDEAAQEWRRKESCGSGPPGPVLELEGPQFDAQFDGRFEIAGSLWDPAARASEGCPGGPHRR